MSDTVNYSTDIKSTFYLNINDEIVEVDSISFKSNLIDMESSMKSIFELYEGSKIIDMPGLKGVKILKNKIIISFDRFLLNELQLKRLRERFSEFLAFYDTVMPRHIPYLKKCKTTITKDIILEDWQTMYHLVK